MAQNRNGRGKTGEYGGWADEPSFEEEMLHDTDNKDGAPPPRDILETDSAKYTAEFVKGVVKGLYTAGANNPEDETAGSEYRIERSFEPEPVYKEAPKSIKKVQREYEDIPIPKRRGESEKPRAAREPLFDMDVDEKLSADGFMKAYEEKNRQERPLFTKKAGARRTFSSLSAISEQEPEEAPGVKQPKKQSAFAASYADLNEPEEEYVYFKHEPKKNIRPVDYNAEPESETFFRKVSQPVGIEERDGFKSVPAYEEIPQRQDRIPIIINKKVESKPKKTADDYKSIGKNEREKPARKFDAVPPQGPNGANVIAAVFMIAAVVIIGMLVWKINTLSKEAGQFDSEEITGLKEQNALLSQKSGEWEKKYNDLLNDYEALQEENRILKEPPPAPDEPEQSEEDAESAQSADGLVDGYYTVQRGDTLWKISEKYLGSGDRYTEIARLNNMDSSQSLYAGLKIKIPTQ